MRVSLRILVKLLNSPFLTTLTFRTISNLSFSFVIHSFSLRIKHNSKNWKGLTECKKQPDGDSQLY
jgi:hypothetical protein